MRGRAGEREGESEREQERAKEREQEKERERLPHVLGVFQCFVTGRTTEEAVAVVNNKKSGLVCIFSQCLEATTVMVAHVGLLLLRDICYHGSLTVF